MSSSGGSLIETRTREIDGLSIRYAEMEPREVSS